MDKIIKQIKEKTPGLLLAVGVAIVATQLGKLVPIIGGAVFGIVLGILISNIFGRPAACKGGFKFASKTVLKGAIIILGAGINLTQIYKTGFTSLYLIVITITVAFAVAYGIGKLMKVPGKLTSLIGIGTAICGGSAIAALSNIIEAPDEDISYAMSTIFLFNLIAVLIFPPIGHLLGLSDGTFGLWAGTAINDTSSVVAAGYSYSNDAGMFATIIKLTRATMLIPVSLIFAVAVSIKKKRQANSEGKVKYNIKKIFPWFILGFLLLALLNTVGVISGEVGAVCTKISKFCIVVALCAIGLNSNFRQMIKTGIKPMLLGLFAWFFVAGVSITVLYFTGQF